jgi:FMN phosphatase YigB (HAD superfamily)
MLKAILFDLGDTLVDVSTWKKKFPRAIVNFLFSSYGIPKNIAKEKLMIALKEVEEISKVKEIDKIEEASRIYSSLLKEAGYVVKKKEILDFTNKFRDKHLKLLPYAKQTLKLLKKKGYTLYVVSNAKKDRLRRFLEISNIRQFFTKIFISGEVGTTKKERLFEVFLNSTGLKPSECLMVGNDPENDGTALRYGIPFCLVSKDKNAKNYTFKISSLKELKRVLEVFDKSVES